MQLVADAKLLYDLDIVRLGERLVALKDKLTAEATRRKQQCGQLLDKFTRQSEETLATDVQRGMSSLTSKLSFVHVCVRVWNLMASS